MLYFHKRKTGGISLDRVMELREKTKEKIERKKLKEQEKADNALINRQKKSEIF